MHSFSHLFKVIGLFTPGERRRLLLVIFFAIFMALIEIIGVGSIMPFMAVATKPTLIHTNHILRAAYELLGFHSDMHFIIFLGVMVLLFLIFTNVTQAFMAYIKTKFTSMRRHTLSQKMIAGYLAQDYDFFLNRNSHEFVKNINAEINQLITGTLMQFVDLLSKIIQIVLLTAFLFVVNPVSTLGITVAVVVIYGTVFFFLRRYLTYLGKRRFTLNSERAKIVSEAFWGIKEVKITGSENVFKESYAVVSKEIALNATRSEIVGDVPKFALETVAFSSIMFFVLVTMLKSGNFADVAGTVTVYAYGGYRMIPAIQGIFKALTKIRYGAPTAEKMLKEFELFDKNQIRRIKKVPKLPFIREITFSDLVFSYPRTENPVIKGISFSIKANELIGFAGTTGSGKTTTVDIILGLLFQESGTFSVDGTEITQDNVRGWQQNLGYVPQNIFLSNDSINANIAFGVPEAEIDKELVVRAAKMAQIHEFIENELPQKYETAIGERGVRLSGGQRQRIGIARALYRDPSVLIMDEATSALDNHTEQAVMEAIDSLMGTRTIILIAHRLTTLKKCNRIYIMEKGEIKEQGTYEELKEHSAYFKLNNH